jgi:biotin-(acetyl-CoA carboxylase) ligase
LADVLTPSECLRFTLTEVSENATLQVEAGHLVRHQTGGRSGRHWAAQFLLNYAFVLLYVPHGSHQTPATLLLYAVLLFHQVLKLVNLMAVHSFT